MNTLPDGPVSPTGADNSPFKVDHLETADELWAAIAPQPTDNLFGRIYRGQANADWPLVPRALRDETGVAKYFLKEHLTVAQQIYYEAQMLLFFLGQCDRIGLPVPNDSIARRRFLNNFKESLYQFQKHPEQWPGDEWLDIMPLAQHHRVPTRLLDWTRRPQVAAYFAAADAVSRHSSLRGENLAIWALQTDQIERLTFEPEPPEIENLRIFGAEEQGIEVPPLPCPGIRVVATPGATSAHIAAQSGIFTLQKERGVTESLPLPRSLEDELRSAPHVLRKWTLPVTEAATLLRLCYQNYVNATTVFRTYDGAGQAVIEWLEDVSEDPLGANFSVRIGSTQSGIQALEGGIQGSF
jgi:hypothetical protein